MQIVSETQGQQLDELRKWWSDLNQTDHVDGGASKVQQSGKDDADINVIMRRFGATGGIPAGAAGAVYGDFSGLGDADDAFALVSQAERGFAALPPAVRERFGNDPRRLVAFAGIATPEEFEREFAVASAPVPPKAVVIQPGEGGSSADTVRPGGSVPAATVRPGGSVSAASVSEPGR